MKKGFTLLELLVTISIIGILLAIGSVSFSTAQKRGRDSRRRADLKAIQKAMEQCYAVDGQYLVAIGWGANMDCTGGQTVMRLVPQDPKDGSNYIEGSLVTDGYRICVDLEADGVWDGTNEDVCVYSQQ